MAPHPRAQAARLVVERLSIDGDSPFQLQVRTTAGVTPEAQVVTGPDRLVIDVPGATPGPAVRNQTVNRGQVERVRVGLFSAVPRVTRIVLDLNSPPSYNIQTSTSGFTVTLGPNAPVGANNPVEATPVDASTPASQSTSDDGQTVGWVTTTTTRSAASEANHAAPSAANSTAAVANNTELRHDSFVIAGRTQVVPDSRAVRVVGGKGQLEIHVNNATLSEVLFQIQQQTGTDIAIPAGTEQQRVIGDFGPGTASEVLAQLLNGSDLNFVVVGSPNNPYALGSVILTHKNRGPAESSVPPQQPQPQDMSQEPQPLDNGLAERHTLPPNSDGATGIVGPDGQPQPPPDQLQQPEPPPEPPPEPQDTSPPPPDTSAPQD